MALQIGSGRYYLDTISGNVFIGSSAAAGVVLGIYSNTSVTFALWNPAGSGKNAIPISCQIGYVSGTAAASNFAYGFQTGVGSTIATGAPITAFTAVAPLNGYIGQGNPSAMRFAPAAATLTAGCSFLKTMGVSQLVTTAATTSATTFQATEYFDGSLIIPPGTLFVVGGNIATVTTADVTLAWEEI